MRHKATIAWLFTCAVFATVMASLAHTAPAMEKTLVLYLDDDAPKGGNGTYRRPYGDLLDTIERARTEASRFDRVIVRIAPGEYLVKKQFRIDFPVEIQGSNVPGLDLDGWPTGTVEEGTEAALVAPQCAAGGAPVVQIEGTVEAPLARVELKNLTVQGASRDCSIIQVQHVANVVIADNLILGPGRNGIELTVSSGSIYRNFVTGANGCGICVAAGTETAPAEVDITDNRSVSNAAGGLLLAGSTFPATTIGDRLAATVVHNDLSQNRASASLGFGVRILAFGLTVPPEQRTSRLKAVIRDNRIDGNRNSVIIDAGTPGRSENNQCDERKFQAGFELALSGNSITNSLARDAFLSFTLVRVFTAPGNNPASRWQYLHSSKIDIVDPDLTLGLQAAAYIQDDLAIPPGAAVIDHPLLDRVVGGPCPDDYDKEALLNSLLYNGVEIPATFD